MMMMTGDDDDAGDDGEDGDGDHDDDGDWDEQDNADVPNACHRRRAIAASTRDRSLNLPPTRHH